MSAPFKLKNGSVALLAEVPGGLYNAAHLKKIAALADQHSIIIKATEDQRLAMFVAPDQAEAVSRDLASSGLTLRDYQAGVHQPVACVGALCPDSKQDALKASLEITEALAGIEADCALKIGVNGCASCCVPCHTLDIALTGSDEGYRMTIGGKQSLVPELGSFAAEGIPAGEVVAKVKAVVDAYKEVAQPGERLAAVIERCGMSSFIKALAPYSRDAGGVTDEVLEEAAVPAAPEAQPSTDSVSEDAAEQSLSQSIAEEASIPPVADENAADRDALMESLPMTSDEVVSAADVEEEAPAVEEPDNVTPITDGDGVRNISHMNGHGNTMNIVGMEVAEDGKFAVNFSNGAAISVDPGVIPFGGSRSVKFAGKELLIRADARGFNIEVDGLTFHLPLEAA